MNRLNFMAILFLFSSSFIICQSIGNIPPAPLPSNIINCLSVCQSGWLLYVIQSPFILPSVTRTPPLPSELPQRRSTLSSGTTINPFHHHLVDTVKSRTQRRNSFFLPHTKAINKHSSPPRTEENQVRHSFTSFHHFHCRSLQSPSLLLHTPLQQCHTGAPHRRGRVRTGGGGGTGLQQQILPPTESRHRFARQSVLVAPVARPAGDAQTLPAHSPSDARHHGQPGATPLRAGGRRIRTHAA